MNIFKTALSATTGFLGGIQPYLIVGAVTLGLGLTGGALATYKIMHNANLAAKTEQADNTVHLVVAQSDINTNLGTIIVPQLVFVQTETARNQQEIAQHVTPEIDRTYPVPLGFVRVWNDRTHGPIPSAAAGRDEDGSGVALSSVAGAHNEDVSALDACRVDLNAWWLWYDQQSAVFNKANHQ